MHLQEFFDYKNRLMYDLINNEDIVKLVDENACEKDAKSLIYTNIFPYEHVPQTAEKGKTFICCDVDIQSSDSKTYYTPILYIWVFAHISLQRLTEGGVRVDTLCSKIAEALDGSKYYGLGELTLNQVRRFAPIDDYLGKVMIFYMKDFNRPSPSGKVTPRNRKVY